MSKPKPKPLHERLRKLREEAGLNKRQLCLKAGIDDAYYGRIEKGAVAEPSFATVCAIADALNISLESFRV